MHTNLVVLLSVILVVDTFNLVSIKTVGERFFSLLIYAWVAFTFLTVIGVIK